jgi:diacylglycerol kinase (ATP)
MRKAILLYNPLSGRRRAQRLADVQSALSTLQAAGVETAAAPTAGAGEASAQVKQAIIEECDTVFACGGDGTVHDVLQGVVGTDAALAIIPLGTANSLAHDLDLPRLPAKAAAVALRGQRRRIAVGRIACNDFQQQLASRYFIVTVGIGVDAAVFYKLNARAKRRLGIGAYYAKAVQLWLTHKMERFAVEFAGASGPRRAEVSQLLAVRIRNFGGVLREIAPGASLDRNDLRLVLFRNNSRIAYLRYIMRGLLGTRWQVPGIELIDSLEATCHSLEDGLATKSRVFVEADGELLGTLPAQISIVPDAVTLLAPNTA